jgi:hypothetical protein
MFKVAQQEQMHIIPYGHVVAKWNSFVNLLFEKTQGFMEYEKTSVQSIRVQYDSRIAAFEKEMGWADGRCQNLSGKEGDKSELYEIISTMLEEKYSKENEKKLQDADKVAVDNNEVTVLIRGLGRDSKHTRKPTRSLQVPVVGPSSPLGEGTMGSPESGVTEPGSVASTAKKGDTMSDILRFAVKSFEKAANPSPKKKLKMSLESEFEAKLQARLTSLDDALTDGNIHPNEDDMYNLCEIGLPVLVSIYCTPDKNFDAKFVKDEYKELGLPPLIAHKLYLFFHECKRKILTNV